MVLDFLYHLSLLLLLKNLKNECRFQSHTEDKEDAVAYVVVDVVDAVLTTYECFRLHNFSTVDRKIVMCSTEYTTKRYNT